MRKLIVFVLNAYAPVIVALCLMGVILAIGAGVIPVAMVTIVIASVVGIAALIYEFRCSSIGWW